MKIKCALEKITVLLTLFFLVALGGCTTPESEMELICEEIIDFPDPHLETAVRDAIGKPYGDINESDVIDLEHLNAYGSSIGNIYGIHCLTGLITLTLGENDIVDIRPLSPLTNLSVLYIRSNEIVDFDPLSSLTNLKELGLANNKIVDISPLSSLTKLEWLELQSFDSEYLSPNEIVDIDPLSSLTNLKYLNLYSNKIVDIGVLVANPGIDSGDTVNIKGNNLDCNDQNVLADIQTLEDRFVDLEHDCYDPSS